MHLAKLKPVNTGGELVDIMGSILLSGVTNLGSEQSTTVTLSFMLQSLFRVLNKYGAVNLPGFRFLGNRSEAGTSTKTLPPLARPDLTGIISSATVYIAEDKIHDKFMDAVKDLSEYASGGLSVHHYGDVRYVFGHAASEPELQFFIITHDGKVGCCFELIACLP